MISLAGGLPDPTLFPTTQLAEIASRVITSGEVLQYGTSRGEPNTRRALSGLFSDVDIPANELPDHMAITTGAQQSIELLAQVLLDPGDLVVVGNPEYLGALQIFQSYDAHLAPISIDEHGLDTAELEHALRNGLRPKACYLVKNFHNPTGATLSPDRKRHLGELATEFNFVIIDDDPYRELYETDTPSCLSHFPAERTASLRSTSKTLAPGLRIGAVTAPSWLLEPLIVAKQSCDLHTSTLSQAVAAEALRAPWYRDHLERVRASYTHKRQSLMDTLDDTFRDRVAFSAPSGGMFLWVRVVGCADTALWLRRALDVGVCFVPGATFATAGTLSDHIRLSYATGSPSELAEGVQRLARSL